MVHQAGTLIASLVADFQPLSPVLPSPISPAEIPYSLSHLAQMPSLAPKGVGRRWVRDEIPGGALSLDGFSFAGQQVTWGLQCENKCYQDFPGP